MLEEVDRPPSDQPVVKGVEEASLNPAPDQTGPSMVEPPDLDEQKKRYPVVMPYMKGVSEQLRRVMKGYRLKVYFNHTNALRELLVRMKDKGIKESVLYPV